MRQTFNPIRLLAEILVIVVLAQAAVMLALPVLAPASTAQTRTLLGMALLALLASPTIYWRAMVAAGRAPGVPVRKTQGDRSLGWAVVMTAAAQLLGLALTAALVVWQKDEIEAAAQFKFEHETERIAMEVKRRFDQPVSGLMGARGMFAAASTVDRGAFRAYVESRDLAREFPGVRGFGFIERVMRKDLARFVAAERSDHAPDFTVHSGGTAPDLFVIKYIEPLVNNREAWGFDVGQEAVRREAAERAVSTGKPALTGRITLVQDGKHGSGFLYFMPVYRQGAALGSPQQRQAALLGLMYVPIVAAEIMDGAVNAADGLLDFELFEGDATQAGNLLFDADLHLNGGEGSLTSAHFAGRQFDLSRDFVVGGRRLVLRTSTTPAFDATVDRTSLAMVGLSGTLASTLLALTVWLLAVGRVRAQRRAERMTADLDRLARVVKHTSSSVVLTDPQLRITWINEAFTRISGYTLAESQGRTPGELLTNPHADPAAVQALLKAGAAGEACRVEVLNRAKEGRDYWIETEIRPMHDAQGVLMGFMEIGADITARKQAEQARFALESELRTMLDVFPGYVARASEDFRYEYANERFAALFGLSPEQMVGRHSRDVLGESGYEATRRRREQIVASGQPISFERHFDPRSGAAELDLLMTHFMVDSARSEGRRKFYQFGIDISERKRVERALAAREAELSAVLDAFPGMLARVDDEMRYTYVNESFAKVLGLPRERIVGRTVCEILGAEREAQIRSKLPHLLAGHAYQDERRYPVDGGDDLVVQVSFVSGPDAERPGHTLLYAFGVDVTELRRQQQRLASIIHGTNAGTFEWNVQTGEARLNQRWAEIAGYTLEELEPISIETWARLTHDDDLLRARELLASHFAGTADRFQQEVRVRHKDGHWIWALDRGRLASRTPQGEPLWMMGTRLDITPRKLAEEQLVAARDEAERANQAKSGFLSSMSHELRTPLNAILGFGQLMEIDTTLPREQQDNLREILKAGHHLLELINEVLDLARVESGRIDLSLESVEVRPLVDACLVLVSTLADKRAIRISHACLPGMAVRADRTRLKQALLNLLSNAIKYNREGGSVTLALDAASVGRMRIRVTDTGPGIPAARLAELFQPFNRLGAESSDVEGTGIGLTITRRLVEMMGGSVDVESELGVGSSFWIELPLDSSPCLDHDDARAAAVDMPARQGGEALKHSVLYIEDNASNIRLVTHILGRRGDIKLLTAQTPESGLEMAAAHRPELILLDINMPGMNGYQVLRVLKSDARLKDTPVVAVTANAMPRDIERGMAAGFSDYLTKPIDVKLFHVLINRMLAHAPGQ